MVTTTYRVEGMTCEHCERAVISELLQVSGVTAVDVAVVPDAISIVSVVSDAEIARDRIAEAIDEAGFSLVEAGVAASGLTEP